MNGLRRGLMYMASKRWTVDGLIAAGYLTETSGNVSTAKALPCAVADITDFKREFMQDDGSDVKRMFVISDVTHLSTEQQNEVIDIYNAGTFEGRTLTRISLKNFNLPERDVYIRRGSDSEYDYHHDFARGSTFNSVTIDFVNGGNLSSMNSLFRGAKIRKITFVQEFRPTDVAGMVEWNNILTSFPSNINWEACSNIGYAFETCRSLGEIPSHIDVTDEESRITLEKNIIGCNASVTKDEVTSYNLGITDAQQAFNQCSGLTRIGPVLDMKGIKSYPASFFNDTLAVTDIRIKNLNCTWSFAKNGWAGIPNMDVFSIIYCLKNLMQQEEGVTQTVTFGDMYASELLSTISAELLSEVTSKGWSVYIGEALVTEDSLTS